MVESFSGFQLARKSMPLLYFTHDVLLRAASEVRNYLTPFELLFVQMATMTGAKLRIIYETAKEKLIYFTLFRGKSC